MIKKLNKYVVDSMQIKNKDLVKIKSVNPVDLIVADRLDIIAKYVYAKSYFGIEPSSFAEKLYFNHLKILTNNKFTECDYSNKNNYDKYLLYFNKVLLNIKKMGFLPKNQ